MGWKTSAALLALSVFGAGSLVYFLFYKDDETDDCLLFKSSETTVAEVKVSKEVVGIIIGRGGQTLRELESKSRTTIHIKDDPTSQKFKVCVIKGSLEATQYAECLIHEIIVSQPLIETYQMNIPEYLVGRIIGKGGETIRMICRNSNAKISVENPAVSSVSLERKLTIKGTPEQIGIAKMLVEQKLDEEITFRNMLEIQMSHRSPRNKPKYLLPARGEEEDTYSSKHKERFVATGSNGLLEVYVSALQNPDRLWLQMMGPCTVDLDRLNEQMTDYYSKEENRNRHKLKEVKCGQIVAAPFAYDDKWYRAEVLDVKSSSDSEEPDVVLYYVDYGDDCSCKKKDVCELRTDFLRLRFQAVECKLAKIKPKGSTWTDDAIDLLDELTHVAMWKSLVARIHSYKERPTRAKREGSPVPCVELFDTRGEKTVNVAKELVDKGFAVWEEGVESAGQDEPSSGI